MWATEHQQIQQAMKIFIRLLKTASMVYQRNKDFIF